MAEEGGREIRVISRTKDVPQNAAEYFVTYYKESK